MRPKKAAAQAAAPQKRTHNALTSTPWACSQQQQQQKQPCRRPRVCPAAAATPARHVHGSSDGTGCLPSTRLAAKCQRASPCCSQHIRIAHRMACMAAWHQTQLSIASPTLPWVYTTVQLISSARQQTPSPELQPPCVALYCPPVPTCSTVLPCCAARCALRKGRGPQLGAVLHHSSTDKSSTEALAGLHTLVGPSLLDVPIPQAAARIAKQLAARVKVIAQG